MENIRSSGSPRLQANPLIQVWIDRAALLHMVGDADSHFPNETGGVLMGYWASGKDDVVITDAIGGGPLARRMRKRFSPDSEFQAKAIAEIYATSGGVRTYLGDWHTHPRGRLALSLTDKQTLRRIAKHPAARASSPIMVLLAGEGKWRAAAWCWLPHRKFSSQIQVCNLVAYDP